MEAYSEGGVVDMVMELCKGNLQEFIADNVARLPNYHRVYIPPEATTIAMVMQKLLETVLFLHEKRVAHRDIKPENVLKSSSGRWKLADFNLATSFEPKRFMRDNVGTLPFQAPEVPQRKYTEKCDIHSMGVLFINLVTGKHYWRPEHTQNQEDIEAGKELMSEKTWKGNKLGTDALDFAKQMVAPENERYSAEEALGNPRMPGAHDSPQVHFEVKNPFLEGDEFMQFVCLYESRLHELYRAEFLKYERGPGTMSVESLPLLLSELGLEPRRVVIEELLQEVCGAKPGSLEFRDVAAVMELLRAREGFLVEELERFRAVFQDFDSDASGDMSAAELGSALSWLGFPYTNEKVQSLYKQSDMNGNGVLSESEFVICLRHIQDAELSTIRQVLRRSPSDGHISSVRELEVLLMTLGYQASAPALADAMQEAKLCPPKMDPEQLQVVPYAAWGRAWGDAVHGSASV
ncbi:unnamed protein product [Durusdinium trenchii]|uniref:Calmodulin n=1 Tax=Durusdinium trenchii TaxID=1381693 RepID=A0ABP0IR47_9DINO